MTGSAGLSLTRRGVLTVLPASTLLLPGCARTPSAQALLEGLVSARELNRAPAAGIVVMRDNIVIAKASAGDAVVGERPFSPRTALRAASISKVAVALTAEKLHRDGVIDMDKGVRTWLPFYPSDTVTGEAGPTLRALLSHTGGMKDPDVYWMPLPGSIESLLTYNAFKDSTQFEYCNLAYGVVATALEAATQRRFDWLSRDFVFEPMGLDVGFNWSGVSAEKKRAGATLYREFGTGWAAQTDDRDILLDPEPFILKDDGADLRNYTIGTNGTLFSPQGGLRASLIDLATLAARLKYAPELTRTVWSLNQTESNGVHDQRYFTKFGTGIQIHPAEESLWPGYELWGHPGEAYGLYSGAWYVPDLEISFAYAVTGTPNEPPPRSTRHPSLNTFTDVLMEAVMSAYEASPAAR